MWIIQIPKVFSGLGFSLPFLQSHLSEPAVRRVRRLAPSSNHLIVPLWHRQWLMASPLGGRESWRAPSMAALSTFFNAECGSNAKKIMVLGQNIHWLFILVKLWPIILLYSTQFHNSECQFCVEVRHKSRAKKIQVIMNLKIMMSKSALIRDVSSVTLTSLSMSTTIVATTTKTRRSVCGWIGCQPLFGL